MLYIRWWVPTKVGTNHSWYSPLGRGHCTSPDLRRKPDFFKQDFHYEKNILCKFQIDALQLGCFILKNVRGKWILFRVELDRTPQTRQGWSPDLRRTSDIFKQDFHYETNILWKFQIDALQLGCFISKNMKGKWILFRVELARTPQTIQG